MHHPNDHKPLSVWSRRQSMCVRLFLAFASPSSVLYKGVHTCSSCDLTRWNRLACLSVNARHVLQLHVHAQPAPLIASQVTIAVNCSAPWLSHVGQCNRALLLATAECMLVTTSPRTLLALPTCTCPHLSAHGHRCRRSCLPVHGVAASASQLVAHCHCCRRHKHMSRYTSAQKKRMRNTRMLRMLPNTAIVAIAKKKSLSFALRLNEVL